MWLKCSKELYFRFLTKVPLIYADWLQFQWLKIILGTI